MYQQYNCGTGGGDRKGLTQRKNIVSYGNISNNTVNINNISDKKNNGYDISSSSVTKTRSKNKLIRNH